MKVAVCYQVAFAQNRLNPCYNGIKMKGVWNRTTSFGTSSLNPCYNGIKMKEHNKQNGRKVLSS